MRKTSRSSAPLTLPPPHMLTVPPRVAQIHIEEALDCLFATERGRKAASNLHVMLEDSGLSLDGNGWRALEILARAGSQGSQASVRDAIQARLEPDSGESE